MEHFDPRILRGIALADIQRPILRLILHHDDLQVLPRIVQPDKRIQQSTNDLLFILHRDEHGDIRRIPVLARILTEPSLLVSPDAEQYDWSRVDEVDEKEERQPENKPVGDAHYPSSSLNSPF